MKPKSVRAQIVEFLYGRQQPMTATSIGHALFPGKGACTPTKLANVASALRKLAKDGLLFRVEGFGPRGGYGYLRNGDRLPDLRKAAGMPEPPRPIVGDNPIADRYLNHAGVRFECTKFCEKCGQPDHSNYYTCPLD